MGEGIDVPMTGPLSSGKGKQEPSAPVSSQKARFKSLLAQSPNQRQVARRCLRNCDHAALLQQTGCGGNLRANGASCMRFNGSIGVSELAPRFQYSQASRGPKNPTPQNDARPTTARPTATDREMLDHMRDHRDTWRDVAIVLFIGLLGVDRLSAGFVKAPNAFPSKQSDTDHSGKE